MGGDDLWNLKVSGHRRSSSSWENLSIDLRLDGLSSFGYRQQPNSVFDHEE